MSQKESNSVTNVVPIIPVEQSLEELLEVLKKAVEAEQAAITGMSRAMGCKSVHFADGAKWALSIMLKGREVELSHPLNSRYACYTGRIRHASFTVTGFNREHLYAETSLGKRYKIPWKDIRNLVDVSGYLTMPVYHPYLPRRKEDAKNYSKRA